MYNILRTKVIVVANWQEASDYANRNYYQPSITQILHQKLTFSQKKKVYSSSSGIGIFASKVMVT